ncbi:MAG: FAD-dependent oxidoreductase, partial [Gemmatimonadaceae bacterium]|nr:FAD-dependent oxidoreductase [Acetobacteraceae bacterium]
IDWAGVRAHVQGVIADLEPADSVARYERLGATVMKGHARFVGLDALEVEGRRITARRIVVAAGSRAVVPPVPGLDTVPYLTNETLFDVAERPDHLLILGGGPIGIEMAQAHAALGCRVTIVQKGAIAPKDEPELVDGLRATLVAAGITIIEHAEVRAVQPGPALLLADGRTIAGSHLLVAVGRVPNLDGLALDAGRVRVTKRGIATNAGLRSPTNRHVYAAGDIADPDGIGPRYFTHIGSYHAGIIVRGALFRVPARIDYAALPRVTYTDPELAQVGLTEAEARAAGHDVTVLSWALSENDRAVTERDTAGRVKLVVSGNRVLGAGILAAHAGEMIGMWTLAIQERTKLSTLAGMIVPYPTRAEAGKRAAGTHFTPRLFAPKPRLFARLLARLP